jgi:hypothetical protein
MNISRALWHWEDRIELEPTELPPTYTQFNKTGRIRKPAKCKTATYAISSTKERSALQHPNLLFITSK